MNLSQIIHRYFLVMALGLFFSNTCVAASDMWIARADGIYGAAVGTVGEVVPIYLHYTPSTTGPQASVVELTLNYSNYSYYGDPVMKIISMELNAAPNSNNVKAVSSTHTLYSKHLNSGRANTKLDDMLTIIIAPTDKSTPIPAGIIATISVYIIEKKAFQRITMGSPKLSDGINVTEVLPGNAMSVDINGAADRDHDGVPDYLDLYADDPLRSRDTDADGIADYDDPDDDNDGILDGVDGKLNVRPLAIAGKDITANPGETVTLNGTRSSDIDGNIMSYSWAPANVLVGANTATPTYTIPPNAGFITRSFVLTVIDNANESAADTVNVTITPSLPTITAQTLAQSVFAGQSATFTVIANGSGLFYQWRRDGVSIVGATSASYSSPLLSLADSGAGFNCLISNSVGVTSSRQAIVTVNRVMSPPIITSQPVNQGIAEGGGATFSVVATGALSYQWQRNSVDISGATQAAYTLMSTTMADDGAMFQIKLSNADGMVTSNAATLTVTPLVATGTRVTKDLQALYNFSTGSGNTVADRSGVGSPLNLTINGDVTWTATGLSVNSIGSISSSGPATKINEAIKLSHAFTVEAWVTPSSQMFLATRPVGTIAAIQPLLSNSDARNVYLGQGSSQFTSYITSSATGQGGLFTGSGYNVATAELTHIVLARDAELGNIRLYVNGIEIINKFTSGDLSNWDISYPLTLSSETDIYSLQPWLGEYRMIAMYSSGLTAAEVNQNFTSGASGTDPGVVIAVDAPVSQNNSPVAVATIASFDTPVIASSFVYMSGASSTDSDGVIVSHGWVQTAGPTATLVGADTAYPYFYAPAVTVSSEITIQLTVTDDLGATSTALVSIVVEP